MSESFGMQKPNWFDDLIGEERDSTAIARLMGSSRQFNDAVQSALRQMDDTRGKGVMGPSQSQAIRQAIVEALNSDD